MRFQLRKCSSCKRYSMKDECTECKVKTIISHPAKFSPDDKYMRYRLAERYKK